MSPYLKGPHNRTEEQAYLDIQAARRLIGLPTDTVAEQLERLLKLQGQAVRRKGYRTRGAFSGISLDCSGDDK